MDVDELSAVAEAEGVTAMPTFKFYKNGSKATDDVVGGNPVKLEASLKNLWELYLCLELSIEDSTTLNLVDLLEVQVSIGMNAFKLFTSFSGMCKPDLRFKLI